MKLVVGLGNPGRRYERSRHNVGFRVVDRIASTGRVTSSEKACRSWIGVWKEDGEGVLLAKPQTYMNQSGEAVACLMNRFPVTAGELVVVYDDLDLPFGRLRIRKKGGAGGHRGLRSILDHLGTESFVRVRVGLGRPLEGMDPTEYVLSRFLPEEEERLGELLQVVGDAVVAIVKEGPDRAMERYNRIQ